MKIYIKDGTGELVIDGAISKNHYVKNSLNRETKQNNAYLTLRHKEAPNNITQCNKVHYSNIQKEDGSPYSSMDELWTAIDGNFNGNETNNSDTASFDGTESSKVINNAIFTANSTVLISPIGNSLNEVLSYTVATGVLTVTRTKINTLLPFTTDLQFVWVLLS